MILGSSIDEDVLNLHGLSFKHISFLDLYSLKYTKMNNGKSSITMQNVMCPVWYRKKLPLGILYTCVS